MLSACVNSSFSSSTSARRQAGIALISVLLVFALASLLIGHLVTAAARDLQRSTNYQGARQAFWYALGGETLGRQILHADFQQDIVAGNPPSDGLIDNWAQPLEEFEIEQGALRLQINDLQARFNLNNLIDQQGVASATERQQFDRLLQALNVPINLAAVIVDWLDVDEVNSSGSKEDDVYLERTPSFLSANTAMADVSELRQLNGMTDEYYELLAPYLTALPKSTKANAKLTSVNINTVSEQVFSSFANNISLSRAQSELADRKTRKYTDQNPFSTSLFTADSTNISYTSEYFEILVAANFDKRWSYLRSVVHRDEQGTITVLSRSMNKAAVAPLLQIDES
ncbi:MAG: type II secretion system minor pseudopilin GspK [Pseudomonadales bacterium]